MTTITLEVPDELAVRLVPLHDQLPKLLSIAVDLFPAERSLIETDVLEVSHPVFKEVMDFLISRPTPEQIVAFKISSSTQARLEELLDKNQEGSLTDDETTELDIYEQINHLFILLKTHARSSLLSSH